VQIAEQLADDIVDGVLAEGARVPSTNELAAFYRINPATAAKGINVLVDEAVLEKRRPRRCSGWAGSPPCAGPPSDHRMATRATPARYRLATGSAE
jgi:DNA-binding transcriptional MocR family regulator